MDPTSPLARLLGIPSDAAGPVQVSAPVPTDVNAGSTGLPQTYVEQDPKHQGIAGVGRDIFGTLGDLLLTRLHLKPMYAPAQAQRKLSSAEEGIDNDPLGAIQRVTSIDPVFGAKLRDQYIDNNRLEAANAQTKEARDSRLALAQSAQDDRTRNRAASMMDTMSQWKDDRRSQGYAAIRDQVLKYSSSKGLDLSSELPTSYDPAQVDSFIDSSVPVGTQRAQRLSAQKAADTKVATEARQDTQNRNVDSQIADRTDRMNKRGLAKPDKVTNVQTYTGSDGYKHTTRSDGTDVKSPVPVKPTGKSGPPVGYKNKNGLTFKGGDPNDRSNWS